MLSPDLDELNVFLSHSCHNHDEIKKIAKFLESHGIICWKDLTEIRSGQRIHDRISAGLDQADCLIVLITKESVNSDEVLEEVLRARLRSKRIFYLIDSSRSRTDVSRLFSRGAWQDNPNTEDMTNTDDVSNIIEYGERSAALARLLHELNWLRHSKSFI